MSKRNLILLGFVGLAFIAVLLALPAVKAFQDKPVLTDDQKKLVAAAKDAAKKADNATSLAAESRQSADGKVTQIKSITFGKVDDTLVSGMDELAGGISAVTRLNLLTELDDRSTALATAKTDLTKAATALPAEAAGEAEEITAARKEASAASGRLDKEAALVTASKKKLQDALIAIPAAVKVLVDLFPPQLTPFAGLKDADAAAVRTTLAGKLPGFAKTWRAKVLLRQRWDNVTSALNAVKGALKGATAADDPGKALTDAIKTTEDTLKGVEAQADLIPPTLQGAFDKLSVFANGEAHTAAGKTPDVLRDPIGKSTDALLAIKTETELHADLNQINEGWIALTVELRGLTITGFDLAKTAKSAQDLVDADKTLTIAVAGLQDAVTGDASRFEADQVSLYYFTDVERIMKMLNPATIPMGGISDAQARAALERRKLTETELDLSDAQAEVNKDQRRVLELQEELRQSKASFASSESVLLKASRNLTGVQADDKKNQDRLTKAKTDADAAPTDAEKQLAQQRASDEADKSAARLKASELRNEDATRERDAAKERNDRLTNEQTGLPSKIQQARDTLEAAQSAVSRQRRSAFLSAQAESEAFALARDNTPFLFAPAVAPSRDPVKRVLLFAYTDSKTIFLRGNPEDLARVKDIIAKFDKPAPQARLTLWTMELSSDSSDKGTKHFNDALIIIEEELANNRALTAATISFLRDCINREVNRVAAEYRQKITGDSLAEKNRLARLYFYEPEILARLGFNPNIELNQDRAFFAARISRLTIPDPAGTTTLGESLMVLSLGTNLSRHNVMTEFRKGLRPTLTDLALHDTFTDKEDSWKTDREFFPSTRRALGLDRAGIDGGLTAAQLEILHSMEKIAVHQVMAHLNELNKSLKAVDARMVGLTGKDALFEPLDTRRQNLVEEIIPLINWLRVQFGFDPDRDLPGGLSGVAKAQTEQERAKEGAKERANVEQQVNSFVGSGEYGVDPLRTANGREAAADQMLKELIIAVEDDLDRHFVQRMLNRLRERITRDKIGVGVGVLQRTSMLATNRLLARVDPRASAQLGVGEEENILQSVQQLVQIGLATQTAGVLGTLGALDKLPREPPPEIYGINTGNTFQVTPIFDPSGQALRFKFDFVGATRIQEPNGTVNRQLPRIERHTVNTEVQLSNLEMREISRFESNAKIGLPTEYSGGLPIIKDIPKIRPYLPLLGWFVRRGGKAAVVQQSLIFGQTTMYPTIGDIMELLTQQPPTFK